MRNLYLLIFFALSTSFSFGQTAFVENSHWPNSVCIDGNASTEINATFSQSTFTSGCEINYVDVRIDWAKTDGVCPSANGGGYSFHEETYFNIVAPAISQPLAVAGTWTGGESIANSVVTYFRSNSSNQPGPGTPVSGVFRANPNNMSNLIGTSALGNWQIIAGDNVGGDPLVVGYTSLYITTTPDVTNPVINAPNNFSVNNASGQCGANVTYSVSATDLCGITSFNRTAGPASGAFFPVGATTVTHLATDRYGRQTTRSFVVTVNDVQAPSISCPANINTTASPGVCTANVSYNLPTHSDNCGSSSLSLISGPTSGSAFSVGATTVTYRATDGAGNIANCSFTVTVTDTQNPQITCPGNSSINASPGLCSATTTYSTPSATDNCSGVTVTRTAGPASGGTFAVGATTVTHQATDASGNTASCSFVVTVVDNQNPTITCPANISVNNTPNLCSGVATWTAPVGVDNCTGAVTIRTAGPASGSVFAAETTTTITYQVTDGSNNQASCSFTVTVEDSQAPTITCPSNIVVGNDVGFCNAVVTYATPSFSDNCPGVTILQTAGLPSNSQFGVNSSPNTVTFRATDAAGNQTSCSFTITVNDTQSPAITCPSDIVVNNAPGLCNATVSWTPPVGVDNCPGQNTVRTGPAPGSVFNVLTTTTITYTSTDAVNNSNSCSFTVTVNDNEVPVVTCPANQNITFPNCQYTLPNYVGLGLATFSDNCSPLVVTQTPPATTVITQATNVQVSVVDPSLNESICSFTVSPLDNTPPTFDNCPNAPVQVNVNSSCQFFMPDYSTMAVSDVCNPTLTITQSPAAGTPQTLATSVTVFVSDGTNTTPCTFGVQPHDATAPSIICPPDRVEPANANCQFVLPSYTSLPSVVVSDNCDPSPIVTQPSAGNTITGSGTVVLNAQDVTGNIGSCSFTVTVQDNTPPTVNCVASANVNFNANCSYPMGNFTGATYVTSATDNCPGSVTLSQSPSIGTLIGGSSSIVTISGTDAAGNIGTCQITLNITDNTPPAIACPPTQQVNVDGGCDYSLGNFVPLAITSDNCSPVTVTQSPAAATSYDLNVNPSVTVTLTASDGTNTATCNFNVLLNDVTPPSITCAGNIPLVFDANCSATVGNRTTHYTALGDNCTASPVVTQSPSLTTVITGQTTITLTATDASNNSSTCTFLIIPSDTQAPTVTSCPQAPITVNYDASCNYTLADYTGSAQFSDNCDQSLTKTQSPGFGSLISTQSNTTVTITATDDAGNQNTCVITIHPVDVTPPSLACPPTQVESFDPGNCSFELEDYRPLAVATDNCSNPVTLTQFLGAGQVVTGATSVLITATDGAGNSSQCTFSVLPADNTPPTITCPTDQTVAVNAQCSYNMTDMTGLATNLTDNCAGTLVVTQSISVGTSLGANTAVVLTVTDVAGNTANCSFNVLPTDQTVPTITCPQNQTVNVGAGCLYNLISYTGQAVTSDNCDPSVTVTQSPAPASELPITTITTVTLTGTDDATNSASCSFTVTPVDNSVPTISCPTDTVVSTDANCQFVMIDETDNHELIIADNCTASPSVTQSPAAGTILTGNTTVTLTVQDDSGNTGLCTYLYTVQDLVDPTIVCPANQLISSNSSCTYVIPDFTSSALTDDNCASALTITQSPLPLINSIVIDTIITLTVTDGNGNSSDCSFLITADDNDLPNLTCPGDQQVDFDANCEYHLIDFRSLAIATDNCGTPTLDQTQAVDSIITGITTIQLVATDADLNTVSCTFDVIPSDISAPTVSCVETEIFVSTGGQCSFTLGTYTGTAYVSATDNCSSSFTFSQSPVSGSLIGGSTVVTLSTVDASGNIGSCTMIVTPEDNTAPQLFCPADVTVNLNTNCEYTLPNYTSLVFVSDNCDTAPFTINQSPAAAFVIAGEGETVVTFTVEDNSENIGTCEFSVFTEDNQAPSITCPASTTVSANANCEFTLANYTGSATAADNCTISPALTQSPAANADYAGPVVVTIVAADDAGNTNNCSFTVTPVDDTAPSVTCPPNQTPNFTSNCQFTIIDYTSLSSFSDYCDNTPFVSQSPGIGTIVTGDTPVTITVTDDAGNTNSCTFQVEPEDHTAPVVTCPISFAVNLSASCDFAMVDYRGLVTVTDACDNNPTIVQSPSTGTVSGTTALITMTAIDASGNSSTCTFNLLLQDHLAPTLVNCPQNQTVPLSPTCQFVMPNYLGTPLTVSDNCSNTSLSQSPLAGSLIGGATVVTISALDASGNVGTCSFTVTPTDQTPPTILICPPSITDVNDPGICGALTTYTPLNAIDNCGGVIVPVLTAGQASGTIFPVGVTTVTHVATDPTGNTATCSFTVTVTDTENPIILCPPSISANAATGTCAANVTYSLPTVTDNCTNPITPTLSAGSVSGSSFPVGSTTVTYGAVDVSGNTASCSFTITVVDNQAPVITCPNNITVNNNPGICGATVTYALPSVTDNCTNGIVPSLTAGQASGSIFPFGLTTNSYQAVDAAGNTVSCSFTVTVMDNESPVLTCPNDTSISCDASVAYNLPAVTDNCINGLVATQTSPTIGSPFAFGPNLVSFSASDGNGNTGVCSFTVTIVDVSAPSIVCPANQTALFNANCTLAAPNYTGLATSSDNCDGSPVITQSPAVGATLTGPVSSITLTSTDFALNSTSCTFTVSDTRPPLVTCPANQVVASNINCQYSLLNYLPLTTSSDNCGSVTLAQTPIAGTLISLLTTVVVTSTDNLGNQSTCQFTVSLTDNIAPSITCIGNQSAFFDANCQYQLPNYTGQASASDNCDTDPTITQSPAVGSTIIGSSVITLTATDDNGNSTSCSFNVNPIDVISPSITCPSSQVAQFDGNCQFNMPSFTGLATTGDNCSTQITVTQAPAVGSVHSANTIVALTANDGNGNTSSCTFLVIPEDNVDPVIVCPSDLPVFVNSGCQYSLINFTGLGTSSDNCSSSFFVTQSPAIGTIIASTTTITLTTNDGNGNSSTCDFDVIPTDNTAPNISCGSNQAVSFNQDCQFAMLDYTSLANVSDNCSSNILISQSPAIGTLIGGTTIVTLTANDGNGNVSSCSIQVIPADDSEPSIQCPADINVSFNQNCSFSLVNYTGLAVTDDNCASLINVTQNLLPGQLINDTVTVVLTANDGNGNTSSCSFNVNPSDNTAPTIVCPPNANVSLNSNCEFVVPDYKLITTVTDNCGPTSLTQAPAEGSVITVSTSVQMTVTDGNGNSISCSFTVVPSDTELPTITCPSNQTVALNSSCQYQLPAYGSQAFASDNCTSPLLVAQFPPVGTFVVSNTTVSLSVQDASGNTATCSLVVTVQDQTDPVIAQCPQPVNATLNSNCAYVVPNFTNQIGATDNCDASLTYLQQPLAGAVFNGAGTYEVALAVIDDAGNFDSCVFHVTLTDIANPVVTCPPNQSIGLNANCQYVLPSYTTLATASDACGSVVLTQSPPAATIITTQLNATIIATDANGNTATCTFFVNPIPLTVSVTGTDVTCDNGTNGTATVNVTGGTPPYTQNWGGFNPNALSSGNYQVTVSDANGCSVTGSVTINNGASFQIEINPSGDVQVCSGESVVLNAGSGYAVYNWSTGASVQSISVSSPASYWVTVTNAQGCVSNTDTVNLSFYAPLIPDVTLGGDGVLYCTNDTSSSYQWYFNGAPIANANSYWYCPTQSGNYYVRIIDANGCTVNSTIEEHTYDPSSACATGIQEHDLSMDIYPNPSNGQFIVNYSLQHQSGLQLIVFDLLGKQVGEEIRLNNISGSTVIDLSTQADGVYSLRVVLGKDRVFQERLVLVK